MARGRNFPPSRSDRLLGTTTTSLHSSPHNNNDSSSEFREEDIWSTPDDRHHLQPRRRISEGHHRHAGGLTLAFEDRGINLRTSTNSSRIVHPHYRAHDVVSSPRGHHHHHNMATSAPVNVPDWSKILRVESVESLRGMDDGFDDEEEEEPEMVPPHEYLARSRKKAANSVYEGVGRTLKGRDMSRVRDAVWSQTGFNG